MKKQKKFLMVFLFVLSLITVVRVQPNFLTKANFDSQVVPFLSMPKEYIYYTITSENGQFWAKVNGKYPITILNPSCLPTQLPMVYPTPPNTTNICITLNDLEVSLSNYSDLYPEVTHHTAIGEWSMVQCMLENVSESFLLEIQYEHPIQLIDDCFTFLYDLNISPYLSAQQPDSTAYFTINFYADIKNPQLFTTKTNTQWNPLNFTTQNSNSITIIKTQIDSKYSEPLLGDLVITFNDPSSLDASTFLILTSLGLTSVFAVGILVYFNKHKRKNP